MGSTALDRKDHVDDSAPMLQASPEHDPGIAPRRSRRLPFAAALFTAVLCGAVIGYKARAVSTFRKQPSPSPASPPEELVETKARSTLVGAKFGKKQTKFGKSRDEHSTTQAGAALHPRTCSTLPGVTLADGEGGVLAKVAGKTHMPTAAKCQDECIQRARCAQAVYSKAANACYMFETQTSELGQPGTDAEDSKDYHESMHCGTAAEITELKSMHQKILERATKQNEKVHPRTCSTLPGVTLVDGEGGVLASIVGKAKMPTAAKCQDECIQRAQCAQAVYAKAASACYMFKEQTFKLGKPGTDSKDSDDYHESMQCGTEEQIAELKSTHEKFLETATMQNEALQGWKKMNQQRQDELDKVDGTWNDAQKRARQALDSMDDWGKVAMLKGMKVGNGYAGYIRGGGFQLTMNDGPQGYNAYTTDKADKSTQFPSLLTIAASFNPETSRKYAQAVADEFTVKGSNVLLGPDVEIIRSPRSGRSFETLTGEDPYLGSELVRPFVREVQAKGIIATVKHWLDNNQEIYRQFMNVEVSDRAQHEIYMPVFKAAFQAGAGAVMCAYNKVYGEHACENKKLLDTLLREKLGFRGFVVSDWGATHDGVKSAFAGLDIEMPLGDAFNSLHPNEHAAQIDVMAGHILSAIYASGQADGLFGSTGISPGNGASNAKTDQHLNVARETIIDGAVLLKNKNNVLPLGSASGKKIAMVGRYCDQATDSDFLQGSVYSGGGSGYVESFSLVTPYQGIKSKFGEAASITLAQTAEDVEDADVAIVCVSAHAEEGWDRENIDFPDAWKLVHGLREKSSDMAIVVLAIAPGVVSTGWSWDADAVLMLFMPGEQAGVAIAQLLNGEASPAGRLPVSLPKDGEERYTVQQYPGVCPPPKTWCKDMTANFSEDVLIGYRWNDAADEPSAYPFGYGLTYTEFEFKNQNAICSKERAVVTLTVKNVGWRDGAAVPQLYVSFPSLKPVVRQLRGFKKVHVEKDGEANVAFFLGPDDWSYYDTDAQAWVSAVSKGEEITVSLGSSSTDLPWNSTFSC